MKTTIILSIVTTSLLSLTTADATYAADKAIHALAADLPCRLEVFSVSDRPAFLLAPLRAPAASRPWVWYAPTTNIDPNEIHAWMFRQWLDKGIAIAGIDVGESFGSLAGRKLYTELHRKLTGEMGLSQTPCLLPQSRGGLMLYNWAAEHPNCVACIVGIYTVCDLRSYPGLAAACPAYGMTQDELASHLDEHNPISRLGPLAAAGVPIFHIHGDNDKVVPLEANSAELVHRYSQLGGKAELVVIDGKGHQVCSEFFQCQRLVDFVIEHATSLQ